MNVMNVNNAAMNLIPGLEQHIENLPAIKAKTSGPEYFQKSTADMIQNLSDAYGKAPVVGGLNQFLIESTAPVLSAVTSLPYDFYEATQRMEPGSGIEGLYSAWKNEQPWTAMKNRFIGATEPLVNRITNTGNSIGEGIYGLMHGPQMRFKQQQLMNQRKQQMQQNIKQAEAAEAAKQKAAADAAAAAKAKADAAAAQQVQQNIQTYGNQDRPNTGMNAPGGKKGQSPTGGDVEGTPFNSGGLVNFYRYGGFI